MLICTTAVETRKFILTLAIKKNPLLRVLENTPETLGRFSLYAEGRQTWSTLTNFVRITKKCNSQIP
jgi:hypothetical protein